MFNLVWGIYIPQLMTPKSAMPPGHDLFGSWLFTQTTLLKCPLC